MFFSRATQPNLAARSSATASRCPPAPTPRWSRGSTAIGATKATTRSSASRRAGLLRLPRRAARDEAEAFRTGDRSALDALDVPAATWIDALDADPEARRLPARVHGRRWAGHRSIGARCCRCCGTWPSSTTAPRRVPRRRRTARRRHEEPDRPDGRRSRRAVRHGRDACRARRARGHRDARRRHDGPGRRRGGRAADQRLGRRDVRPAPRRPEARSRRPAAPGPRLEGARDRAGAPTTYIGTGWDTPINAGFVLRPAGEDRLFMGFSVQDPVDLADHDEVAAAVNAHLPDATVTTTGGHDWVGDRFSQGTWLSVPPTWFSDGTFDAARGARRPRSRSRARTSPAKARGGSRAPSGAAPPRPRSCTGCSPRAECSAAVPRTWPPACPERAVLPLGGSATVGQTGCDAAGRSAPR